MYRVTLKDKRVKVYESDSGYRGMLVKLIGDKVEPESVEEIAMVLSFDKKFYDLVKGWFDEEG